MSTPGIMPWNRYVIKHVTAIWYHLDNQKSDEERQAEEDQYHATGIRPTHYVTEEKFFRAMEHTTEPDAIRRAFKAMDVRQNGEAVHYVVLSAARSFGDLNDCRSGWTNG